MAILKRVSGDGAGQIIELNRDQFVIGRSPECEIVLDPNGVSRRHAAIRRESDAFFIADLHSRNLTKINEARLDPEREHRLKPGDRINICEVEFVYYDVPPTAKPTPPAHAAGSHAVTARLPRESSAPVMQVTEGTGIIDPNMLTIDASRSSALASAVKPEVKLRAILDIARNLSSELKIDTVAPKVLDSLKQLFPSAERLFLILEDPETKQLIRKAFKYAPNRRSSFSGSVSVVPDDEVPMSISRTIVNFVLKERKAVLSQDAGNDSNLPTGASIADLKIRSVMCVPLLTPDGQALGIIQLDTSDRKVFVQEDLDVLIAVASQAAIAIQNATMHEMIVERERLSRDLKLAEVIQKRFVPQHLPKIPGFEFFAYYHAAYEVGGDYYDFVPLPDNRLGIALGDVAGKGVSAALMMAKFSGDTRYCLSSVNSPSRAATMLNTLMIDAGIDEKFITLSLSVLDPATRRLTLASAGHLPLLIRRANGVLEEVGEDIGGFPLGIMPDLEYGQIDVDLHVGDVVLIFSDGVPDSRNVREELYNRRVNKIVAENSGGATSIGKALLQDIREYSANHLQADDITLICFGPVPH